MASLVLDMPSAGVSSFEIGTLGAFYDPSENEVATLLQSELGLVSKLVSVMDKLLLRLLDSRSAEEFAQRRKEIWPGYVRALRALSDTMSNLVTSDEMGRRWAETAQGLTSDLEKQRGLRFGAELTDQALFSFWTLGKIRDVGRRIVSAGNPPDTHKDWNLHSEYETASLWAQFHLDCMFAAMKFGKPVSVEVQAMIGNGLQAAVNAYSIMKEALSLRLPPVQHSALELPWDAEDDELLASSMRGIYGDTSGS